MGGVNSSIVEQFSITRGGPLHWIQVRFGQAGDERHRVARRALLAILATWLPLLILSLWQREAYGSQIQIPFLRDFAVNARFLIAVPILILAESAIDKRWHLLACQFLKSGLVDQKELPSYEAVLQRITRLRDRALPEALLAVFAIVPAVFYKTELLMSSVSSWHTSGAGSGRLSPAGWWFDLVSTPFFRFLILRWAWRLLLWTLFLWRVSRLNLYLVASHTDLAAGLGFLSEGQKVFSPIVFAGGAVIAGGVGNAIVYQGATLSSMKFPMIAYGVMAMLFLVVPLLVVAPVLLKLKRRALLEYGALVTIHNQLFDRKWIRQEKQSDDIILGNPDPSSLIDLGSSFSVIVDMRVVPINKQTLITLAVAAALPMVPVVLLATPADELVRLVLKMLG